MTDTTVGATGVTLTEAAAAKAASLLAIEGRDDLALRIAVQPGGCSGLRYQLMFDDRELEGDLVDPYEGVSLVVDRMSAPYLGGATIDFVDTIEAQGFTIDNPNATSSCACGDSASTTLPCSGHTWPSRSGFPSTTSTCTAAHSAKRACSRRCSSFPLACCARSAAG